MVDQNLARTPRRHLGVLTEEPGTEFRPDRGKPAARQALKKFQGATKSETRNVLAVLHRLGIAV